MRQIGWLDPDEPPPKPAVRTIPPTAVSAPSVPNVPTFPGAPNVPVTTAHVVPPGSIPLVQPSISSGVASVSAGVGGHGITAAVLGGSTAMSGTSGGPGRLHTGSSGSVVPVVVNGKKKQEAILIVKGDSL